jgi:predicted flap endonuclease-1-like 5' DNA nuclease
LADVRFKNDPSSRRAMRFLLFLQITAMIIVIGLILFESYSLALTVSFLTSLVFITIIIWLYFRYQKIPLVREKADLQKRLLKVQNKIRKEVNNIQAARRKRESLLQEEKDEVHSTLKKSQEDHIKNGLANTSLKHAAIPGVGPKLKERLALHGVVSAAQIGNNLSSIPGFGQAKQQALIEWRNAEVARLDVTKPISLTNEQFEYIMQTYQALRRLNDTAEKTAQDNKRAAEYDLNSLVPRLKQLAPVTFIAYASKSLASRGMAAALIACVLIVAQLISSVGAAASSLIASIPTATPTATATLTPANTVAPTVISSPTITDTATLTFTPNVTDTATLTFTPPATETPQPTLTPLVILQASNTPQIPVSGGSGTGNCDPSYPTVCIPPPPPDLDCGDIPYRRFQVLPPDSHDFDREGDGIGCES